jgi:hypothetical protein
MQNPSATLASRYQTQFASCWTWHGCPVSWVAMRSRYHTKQRRKCQVLLRPDGQDHVSRTYCQHAYPLIGETINSCSSELLQRSSGRFNKRLVVYVVTKFRYPGRDVIQAATFRTCEYWHLHIIQVFTSRTSERLQTWSKGPDLRARRKAVRETRCTAASA